MTERMDELSKVADRMTELVNASVDRWRDMADPELTYRPPGEAWSIKEIIGHLIDSASNNHQRFVRLQLVKALTFPDYGQDNEHWVRIQHYQESTWVELLDLWRHINCHLAHVIRSVDLSCLDYVWEMDSETKVTLFELMVDYLRHLKDHLDQIDGILETMP